MPGFRGATWNPTRGCRKISDGCKHCYAETFAERFRGVSGHAYEQGFDPRTAPDKLDLPLRTKAPTCWFVNSMSDLFLEDFSDEYIAAVFGVMAAAPRHRFLVLTKRAERMRRWFEWVARLGLGLDGKAPERGRKMFGNVDSPWPLPNVFLGVSVENQATADERIPQLLATPAAVRFVSYEPALEAVDFSPWLRASCSVHRKGDGYRCCAGEAPRLSPLQWVIVGGESGPGARTTGLGWIRDAVNACRESGTPCFVKQVGARVASGGSMPDRPRNRKGGDPAEWPEDLRVREWPEP
jgi:protein gp37